VTAEEQQELSRSIVASGCRWALCRGVECSSWDDSIDWADDRGGNRSETLPFVMTTWHADEPQQDTLAVMLPAAFDDFVPTSFARRRNRRRWPQAGAREGGARAIGA
jgi:hypothetical protein